MKEKPIIDKDIDTFVVLTIFLISIVIPVIVATSQFYIVQYGDDIAFMGWAQTHHNPLDVFGKLGTGYRPMMLTWLFIGHSLWGVNPFGFYILNGALFAGAMIFLYLIGKTLHSRPAGVIAVLLYLILDGTFIMVSKLNFIAFSGEIFFITSALYCSIQYYKTADKKFMWPAVVLSILGFMSKEPSLLIIPTVNLTYLWFSGLLKRNRIIINIIPFLYMFLIMFFIAPEVGGSGDILQRFISNLQFYIDAEMNMQFKTPVLFLLATAIAGYYILSRNLRTELMLCVAWFIVGILPFLITRQPVQPTYTIEANLGIVLLIGIVITEELKKPKFDIIMGLVIIGLLFQASMVPGQISNMQNYNKMVSDNQKTFYETTLLLKQIPQNEKVFYFPDSTRQKYGGMQLTPDFFRQYLCLQGQCNINITTSYSDANYIILPSSLDIHILQNEMPKETHYIIKQIKYGTENGVLLKKIQILKK